MSSDYTKFLSVFMRQLQQVAYVLVGVYGGKATAR
jgi:hypothetical protein